jgi:uncharacterized membrane protein YfcA
VSAVGAQAKRGAMLGLWLSLCAFGTAVLSGIFGMAGGILLMGVYATLLPVAAAMVLHGATQLFANGVRAVILWRHIYWSALRYYAVSALLTFFVLLQVRYVPNQLVVFLGIGLAPFVAALLPARYLDFARPHAALVCGVQVTALNLTAGAAGPLLDVAFVDTRLQKSQIVATKAISQVFSHTLKLAYFGPLVSGTEVPPQALLGILWATLLGTWTGTRVLARLSDQRFRVLSRYIVYGIGLLYLCKAAWIYGR